MNENTFHLDFNVSGEERKRLVKAISKYTGTDSHYLGVPTCAYQVGYFTISKEGCVSFDDRADSEEIESLIETLAQQGFVSQGGNLGCEDELHPEDTPHEAAEAGTMAGNGSEDDSLLGGAEANTEPHSAEEGLTVSLPLDGFSPDSLNRLQKLIDSKASLIRKAVGADRLTVQASDDILRFPWWDTLPKPEETAAFTAFIAALCKMAREAKRVTATEKTVESEKYAFRGFLLRMGFIGADSKAQRKLLLKNLSGSAAFPNQAKADAFNAAQKAKRDASKEEVTEEEGTV